MPAEETTTPHTERVRAMDRARTRKTAPATERMGVGERALEVVVSVLLIVLVLGTAREERSLVMSSSSSPSSSCKGANRIPGLLLTPPTLKKEQACQFCLPFFATSMQMLMG